MFAHLSSSVVFRYLLRSNKNSFNFYTRYMCSKMENIEEVRRQLQQHSSGGSVNLVIDHGSDIATLFLNHPEKKNAFDGNMMVQLDDITNALEKQEDLRAVIVYGAGDMFCSGANLQFVQRTQSTQGGRLMSVMMQRALLRLQQLPIVSVALVKGLALGGGAEFAVCCDYRLMTPSSKIQFVQARMGISTGWGGGRRLVDLVGPTVALDLLLSCRAVEAPEAVRMGLANGIVGIEKDPLQDAIDWVKSRFQGSTEVIRAMKCVVRNATTLPIPEALEQESQLFSQLWGGKAQQEALSKFVKHKH